MVCIWHVVPDLKVPASLSLSFLTVTGSVPADKQDGLYCPLVVGYILAAVVTVGLSWPWTLQLTCETDEVVQLWASITRFWRLARFTSFPSVMVVSIWPLTPEPLIFFIIFFKPEPIHLYFLCGPSQWHAELNVIHVHHWLIIAELISNDCDCLDGVIVEIMKRGKIVHSSQI